MKVKTLLFALLVPCLFSLNGCSKYDDDKLWDKVNDHEERLKALEQWQATVNGNISSLQGLISALEAKDYVTSVVPVTEGGVTVGYTINFTKSNSITIRHGVKGDKGDQGNDGQTPQIGVKQHTDGKYYWTLDGEFIKQDGNNIPVTGEKGDTGEQGAPGVPGAPGATPKVAIGNVSGVDYWFISADGSATGTPPAGSGWTNTNVKATGDKGDTGATGPQGDAIFKKDGIDNTNTDYVVLTLADGTTTITLPKYKAMSLSINFPDRIELNPGKSRIYEIKTSVNVSSFVVSKPDGWRVSIDAAMTHVSVTAPDENNLYAENTGVITVMAFGTDGRAITVSRPVGIANYVVFVDPAFKEEMLAKYPDLFDDRGEIPLTAAAQVTEISIYKAWNEPTGNITSLAGIEYFTALETLMCSYHKISSMDLSQNVALKSLSCSNNQLTHLDLSANTALISLWCGHNLMTTIDVSNLPALEVLDVVSYYLTELDVSHNPKLRHLYCGTSSQLTALDLSANTKLEYIHLNDCAVSTLDVSNCLDLVELRCQNNKLTSINIRGCQKLGEVNRIFKCESQRLDEGVKTQVTVWNTFDSNAIPSKWTYTAAKTDWVN